MMPTNNFFILSPSQTIRGDLDPGLCWSNWISKYLYTTYRILVLSYSRFCSLFKLFKFIYLKMEYDHLILKESKSFSFL